ncbi:MAG: EAL domain-containing protein [Hungatella sp.]|nr:EAL domain-containing protein [Hungatella sp.]
MKLFGKKQAPPPRPKTVSREPAPIAPAGPGRKNSCYEYLDMLMSNLDQRSTGTAVKIYIENFKRLNDVFGYDYCEELLQQIQEYLKHATGKRLHHFIGVEYIIIMDRTTSGQAQTICQEILERFEHVWTVGDIDCICSIQIGLCPYPLHATTVDELLKCLDIAVTKASEYGSNQMAVFNTALREQQNRRRTIAMYLNEALDRQEIEVRYRPTYNVEQKKFVRAELYLRIFVKGLGFIGAPEFAPVAEDTGQIRTLEYFALEHLGACIAELIEKGIDFESISTRVSPLMFQQEDFLAKIETILRRYQIPAGKMALEFSENAYLSYQLNMNMVLQSLSEMGVEVILNDFGSGFCSISSLLELPVNTVKFERMFIWQLESNPNARIMVDSLTQMAKNLGLRIIAEGVETQHQLKVLNRADCQYQQGFYYSPTVEKPDLLQLMDCSMEESKIVLEKARESVRR